MAGAGSIADRPDSGGTSRPAGGDWSGARSGCDADPVVETPAAARSLLILGGTAEARALAARLVAAGWPVTSTLAGRVSDPALPAGQVRIGGFGGVPGLVEYLREHRPAAVVDATHPYAATMSAHAVAATGLTGVPLLRLARPGWGGRADAASWHWVDDHPAAARAAARLGERPFLTTGRQTLDRYTVLADRDTLVRVVEPPTDPVPPRWTVIRDRGPYRPDGERDLVRRHRIDVLVTKDSGGAYTSAKLDVAAELGLAVVVVRRPPPPTEVATVTSADEAVHWLGEQPRRLVGEGGLDHPVALSQHPGDGQVGVQHDQVGGPAARQGGVVQPDGAGRVDR